MLLLAHFKSRPNSHGPPLPPHPPPLFCLIVIMVSNLTKIKTVVLSKLQKDVMRGKETNLLTNRMSDVRFLNKENIHMCKKDTYRQRQCTYTHASKIYKMRMHTDIMSHHERNNFNIQMNKETNG